MHGKRSATMNESYLIERYLRMLWEPIAYDRANPNSLSTRYVHPVQEPIAKALKDRYRELGGDPDDFWRLILREQKAVFEYDQESHP